MVLYMFMKILPPDSWFDFISVSDSTPLNSADLHSGEVTLSATRPTSSGQLDMDGKEVSVKCYNI